MKPQKIWIGYIFLRLTPKHVGYTFHTWPRTNFVSEFICTCKSFNYIGILIWNRKMHLLGRFNFYDQVAALFSACPYFQIYNRRNKEASLRPESAWRLLCDVLDRVFAGLKTTMTMTPRGLPALCVSYSCRLRPRALAVLALVAFGETPVMPSVSDQPSDWCDHQSPHNSSRPGEAASLSSASSIFIVKQIYNDASSLSWIIFTFVNLF